MVATIASASDDRAAACEEHWKQESAKTIHGGARGARPDYEGLLARWLSQRQRCAGTVAWEARLAVAYVAAGKPDDARKVLSPLQGGASEYAYLVDLASLQVEYFGLEQGPVTKDRLEAVEKRFEAYVRKHPGVPEGHAQLGALRTMLGEHADAVASLTKALNSSMDLSGVYRNLTISYSALGRYADAMKAADEAVDRGPDMFVDSAFVYAAAKAFAASGKIGAAVNALNVIATKRPELQKDPAFWDAANFVKAKKAAANP
jgi:tetratricopeptide (TPR) repeat protein